MARPDAATLAVFGTGEQARLQVEWLARLRPVDTVRVHGRSQDKTRSLCQLLTTLGHHAQPASAEVAVAADMVITTTPATAPVPARRSRPRGRTRNRHRHGHATQE